MMNEHERGDLAQRVSREVLLRYGGVSKAAYMDAAVNSGTWGRVERGLPIADRTTVAIVKTLWPETGGDWRELDPPLGGVRDLQTEVLNSNLSPRVKEELLARLAAEQPPERKSS